MFPRSGVKNPMMVLIIPASSAWKAFANGIVAMIIHITGQEMCLVLPFAIS